MLATLGLCTLGLIPNCCNGNSPDQKPPNILFVMSDNQAYQAISVYGSGLILIPNFYRIAK